MHEIEECSDVVHEEVNAWWEEGYQMKEHLKVVFVSTLINLEEAHQNTLEDAKMLEQVVPKSELPIQKGKISSFALAYLAHQIFMYNFKLLHCIYACRIRTW